MLAAKSLGNTTTICTDKTRTLTRSEMTVKKVFVDNKELDITGTGYIPTGKALQAGKDIMKKPPKNPKRKLLNSRNTFLVATIAVFMAVTAYLLFWYTDPIADLELARTVTFATIVLMVAVHAFNFRSLTNSLFKINVFENRLLVLSALVVTPLLVATIYWMPAASIFEHVPMNARDLYIAAFGAFATLVFIETVKHFGRHWYHNDNEELIEKDTV